MQLRTLSSYPGAVCTDGSPAGYYYAPATTSASAHTWIVHLRSGGMCYSEVSCRERCWNFNSNSNYSVARKLCSSHSWEESITVPNGLMSADGDPLLAHAHKVHLRYCTSDAHWGDAEAFDSPAGGLMQFRGSVVVEAMLADLVARHGLGSGHEGARDTMVFAGNSAGARGAMVHLDYVPQMLQSASAHVDVVGFLDSPMWLDMDVCCGESSLSLPNRTRLVHAYVNTTRLGVECAAAWPLAEQWRCLLAEYRLPFLASKFVVVASLHDTYLLGQHTGANRPTSPAGLDFAARAKERMLRVLRCAALRRRAG